MIKNKKQSMIVVGAFILVLMLFTTTYAFFNYTRIGSSNTIKVGRISFNSTQGNTINLTNMFPIEANETNLADSTKVGTVTINVTGDTTYTEGIEYLVTATNVQNTVNNKSLPISVDVSYSANTNKTIGTEDEEYFDNRGGNTSLYRVLAKNTISNNEKLVVGYIKSDQTGIDGNIVIKAYIDKAKVAISDTYPEENEDTNNDGYIDGTPESFGENRTIFTTTEWNSLQQNGVSFQIKVESQEGMWVPTPVEPICKRATQLHTTTCNNGTCRNVAGIGNNGTITYGNLETSGTPLNSGDALDCDLNGNGIYDERFYYVTDNGSNAVLIYYKNYNVQPSWGYDTFGINTRGPVTAASFLPSTEQWTNSQIIFPSSNRQIVNELGEPTTNDGINIITNIAYTGKAARLLTTQELVEGCSSTIAVGNPNSGGLDGCIYLLEKVGYFEGTGEDLGYWLETPHSSYSDAWYVSSSARSVRNKEVEGNDDDTGTRPVIEVLKTNIAN